MPRCRATAAMSQNESTGPPRDPPGPSGDVLCPVCNRIVQVADINDHCAQLVHRRRLEALEAAERALRERSGAIRFTAVAEERQS
jgi:hypothetical protein